MNVWYLTADLMFPSRVIAQAERAGHAVVMAASPAVLVERLKLAASEPPGLVIIDLTTPGLNVASVVSHVRTAAASAKVLAYGPHVLTDLLAAAQTAGCDAVMSNGQFNGNLASILSS